MDDNRMQATSAYRSVNKHVSGCDRKRDSSFVSFGISPSKLISDMASAGYCLLPGAAAHHKKNRPVNTRAGIDEILIAHLDLSVTQRAETGIKKDRGGENIKSSCHMTISVNLTYYTYKIADSEYFTLRFSWLLFLSTALSFLKEFTKFCLEEVHIK